MKITHIELRNFRNYEELSLDLDPEVNLIIGKNAQGKTNLIEAIYLSSIGRSFRTSHDREMIRMGQDTFYVKVNCEKEVISTRVEISSSRAGKKIIKKDGQNIRKMSELLENILIVIFSPDDLRIVKDEPEKRRKFIDRELSQVKPAYYSVLTSYKKTLQERNACLKEEKNLSLIDLYDEQLIHYGAEVISMRKEFVEKISRISGKIHSLVTNGREEMEIRYDPNVKSFDDKKEQEEEIRRILERSREQDIRFMTTSRGPHKDDIQFFVNGMNARNYGSQGQQRTAALSLKLAELELILEETGERAVLLLDDVMSELDEERRTYLIGALRENQLFITTTDIDENIRNNYPEARIFTIEKGKVI